MKNAGLYLLWMEPSAASAQAADRI